MESKDILRKLLKKHGIYNQKLENDMLNEFVPKTATYIAYSMSEVRRLEAQRGTQYIPLKDAPDYCEGYEYEFKGTGWQDVQTGIHVKLKPEYEEKGEE